MSNYPSSPSHHFGKWRNGLTSILLFHELPGGVFKLKACWLKEAFFMVQFQFCTPVRFFFPRLFRFF